MSSKYPFIKAVSIILRIIWYLQWLFLLALIVISILLSTNSSIVNIDKLKGFNVQFTKINIPNSISNTDNLQSDIYLSNGEGRLHIKNIEHRFIFYRLLSVFVDTLLFIFVIFLLQKIFSGLKTGSFFVKQNGVYIRKIAYAVLGIALLPKIIDYVTNIYITNNLDIDGIVLKARFDFDYRTTSLALLIFVIAKVFIKGAELREDHDLTI
ncbi:MAG: hypothetical protein B6I20_06350 [Bacteroidetes bacterium 4572_117]|nr:MAG: hypothetical protein B6I20_06350 [Bacteroidetes bacterium 4572_117]